MGASAHLLFFCYLLMEFIQIVAHSLSIWNVIQLNCGVEVVFYVAFVKWFWVSVDVPGQVTVW